MTDTEDATKIFSSGSIRCVGCAINVSSTRELFGICQRATRTYEGGEVVEYTFALIAGIPFVMPSGFAPTVERIEGEDLVVETPLPVCDECWDLLDGGSSYRLLSWCSQAMGTAAAVTFLYILYANMRGATISLLWPLGMLACAIPPFLLAESIRSHWEERLKEYMRTVVQYDSLLNAFPSLELRTSRPNALMDASHADGETYADGEQSHFA